MEYSNNERAASNKPIPLIQQKFSCQQDVATVIFRKYDFI